MDPVTLFLRMDHVGRGLRMFLRMDPISWILSRFCETLFLRMDPATLDDGTILRAPANDVDPPALRPPLRCFESSDSEDGAPCLRSPCSVRFGN